MSGKNTLGLLIALVCLIGAYFAVTLLDTRQERAAYDAKRLFDFDADAIGHLLIAPAGREEVEGMRELGGAWDIKTPYDHIPANPIVWNRLAQAVATLTNERPIESNTTALQQYELDTPHLKLTVATHDGEYHELRIGALEPTQEYRYSRVDNGDVVLTKAESFHELNRSLDDLRDRQLFHADDDGFERLEFARYYRGGDEKESDDPDAYVPEVGEESVVIALVRRAGVWQMVSPVTSKANQEKVKALINEVQFAVGRNYIDHPESLSDYALDPPNARISLKASEDSPLETVYLGGVAGDDAGKGIFVRREGDPSVFVIDAHVLTLVPNSPSDFRETRMFNGELSTLSSVNYTHKDTEIELTQGEGGAWRMTQPPVDDTDSAFVSRFLGLLRGSGGITYPESGDFGFDQPRTRIVFHYADGSAPTELLIGNPVPESEPVQYYMKQDDGSIVTVPIEMVLALTVTPYHFRQKEMLRFTPANAREVRLSLSGDTYQFKKVGATWSVLVPEGHLLDDQADMSAILDVLAKAKATKVVDPVPSIEVQGLDVPTLSAEVDVAAPDGGQATLGPMRMGNLAAAQSRERFATMAGTDTVYLAEQMTIDDLREALKGVVPKP